MSETKLPGLPEPDGTIELTIAGMTAEVDAFRASTLQAYARQYGEALRGDSDWRSIDEPPITAFNHTLPILVFIPGFGCHRGGYTKFYESKGEWPYYAESFSFLSNREITHWRPMPAAPKALPGAKR